MNMFPSNRDMFPFIKTISAPPTLRNTTVILIDSTLSLKKTEAENLVNEIFDLQFFHYVFESAWATELWVKIFSFLVKNSQSYSNFKF